MVLPSYSLTLSLRREGTSYQLELAHDDPTSQGDVEPVRARAPLDPKALLAVEGEHQRYGQLLAKQLLADAAAMERFVEVETAAQTNQRSLRLQLAIHDTARELESLRWELLRHPSTGVLLTTSENLYLSRFMSTRDMRPVRAPERLSCRALIVISAPNTGMLGKLSRMRLAPVDFEAERQGVEEALGDVKVEVLGGPGSPATLEALLARLRTGPELVYLVCHGRFARLSKEPALILQDESGEAKAIKASALTQAIAELSSRPLLMVLASCQSAGTGRQDATAQASLAGRLADAGVPAVLAMQGLIPMATVQTLMPAFFEELLRDGQIDRALAVARSRALRQGHTEAWMPALYSRLKRGQLWAAPAPSPSATQQARKIDLHALEAAAARELEAANVQNPGALAEQIAAEIEQHLLTQGQLRPDFLARSSQGQALHIQDIVEEVMSEAAPYFLELEEPFKQLLTQLGRALGVSKARHSRFDHILDRTQHWKGLRLICEAYAEHYAFVIHGASHQNVAFFCKRVRHFIQDDAKVPHELVEVQRTVAEARAELAEDWARHLHLALGEGGTLAEALDLRTRERRLMIMLIDNNRPLRTKPKGERFGLGKTQREELCTFLSELLPQALAAAKCERSVRVLVPIEYRYAELESSDRLFKSVRAALQNMEGVEFEDFDPLSFPNWPDVRRSVAQEYAKEHGAGQEPPRELLDECKRVHREQELRDERERSFAELAAGLDHVLDQFTEED